MRRRTSRILLTAQLLGTLACARPPLASQATVIEQPPSTLDAAPPGAKKRALLVGINDYKYDEIRDLRGTQRDLENMRDVLTTRYGFDPAAVITLRDREATLHAIVDAFERHLIAPASEDTVTVFYFSGHGSQVRDADGDELDGWDETLVTYDSGRPPVHENRDLTDDVLNGLLARLNQKTKHAVVILDSCHSGTAVRNVNGVGTAKVAPRDGRGEPPALTRGTSDPGGGMVGAAASYTLISGAGSTEFSYEREFDGRPSGAMTWFLADALRREDAPATYRDLMDTVKAEVTASYPSQHPQLEGAAQDEQVFGTTREAPAPFVAVRREGRALTLAAGQVHGVTRDSIFALFPAGAKEFPLDRPLLRAKVTAVQDLTATLVPVTPVLSGLPDSARAVEHEHRFESAPVRIAFRDGKSALIAGVRERLLGYAFVREVAASAEHDFSVGLSPEHGIVIAAGSGDAIAPPIARDADAIEHTVRVVLGWARWRALRELKNPATSTLSLRLELGAGTRARAAGVFDPGEINARFSAGDDLSFTIVNDTADRWFVYLLNLGGDGSVSLMSPPGANEVIEPFSRTLPKVLRACTPGKQQVVDTLKVFFTRTQTDFSFLSQSRPRRVAVDARTQSEDPFQALVETAAGTRGTRLVSGAPSGWAARQRAIGIAPREGVAPCSE